METIFFVGGMKSDMALSAVVFPLAVPPQNRIEAPFSTVNQRYAAIWTDNVPFLIKSIGVRGVSRNL